MKTAPFARGVDAPPSALTRAEVREMVLHAFRDPMVMPVAWDPEVGIRPEHFLPDKYLALAWDVASKWAPGRTVPPRSFSLEYQARCPEWDLTDEESIRSIAGDESDLVTHGVMSLAYEMFNLDPKHFESDENLKRLKIFLTERRIAPALIRGAEDIVASGVEPIRASMVKFGSIESLLSGERRIVFAGEPDFSEGARQVLPTRLDWFDGMIGGQSWGDITTLCMKTGQGKSIIFRQAAAECAREFRDLHAAGEHSHLKHVILIITDTGNSGAQGQRLMISYLAQIHRSVMTKMKRTDELSTSAALKDYEVRMYNRLGTVEEHRVGEQERYREGLSSVGWLLKEGQTPNLHILDYTQPDKGRGGIDELKADIDNFTLPGSREQVDVGAVYIDQAYPLVQRWIEAKVRSSESDQRKLLNRFGGLLQENLVGRSGEENRIVWYCHQLDGQDRSPNAQPSAAWVQECKTLEHYVANLVVFGSRGQHPAYPEPATEDEALEHPYWYRFKFCKHRHGEPSRPDGVVIRQSHLGCFRDASDVFAVTHGMVNLKADARGVSDPSVVKFSKHYEAATKPAKPSRSAGLDIRKLGAF
jgi:hypothetical protein